MVAKVLLIVSLTTYGVVRRSLVIKICFLTFKCGHEKATEQCFPEVLFVMLLYKVFLTLESV